MYFAGIDSMELGMLCILLLQPVLDIQDPAWCLENDSELKGWCPHEFATFLAQCLRKLETSWQAGPEMAGRFIEASAQVSASAYCSHNGQNAGI